MSEIEKRPDPKPAERETKVPDPFSQMIQFYDTYAKSWSATMSEAVASKGFADAMGQQMESSLEALTLWRRQMGDIFEQYLQQMSLPTKGQVASLSERLTNVEMAVQDLDEKADQILDLLKAPSKKGK